ncbi:hypothetical protein T459_02648 [Capsicum annuum]|uniref:Uncharacterized protein n=1 Tax=Capsicum annuum TaxID=4072 RepID=A0A2G3AKJ3_CAPAN|nr:hypothetical protein FXO37_26789 [Capsicum annuum]PHT94766.1 hypothetical protein T459_02648 [Capsicum annuum]
MEDRLKEDVLLEAARYGNKILVTDELPNGQMVDQWEPVTYDSVKTPLQVYEELQSKEYLVEYERVPITDEKSPKELDFDILNVTTSSKRSSEKGEILSFGLRLTTLVIGRHGRDGLSQNVVTRVRNLPRAENHWSPKVSPDPHGAGLWKHVNSFHEALFQSISFKVGNSLNVKFWKDRWIGNGTLKELLPSIFLNASNLDTSVAQNREDNIWRPLLRMNLNDWEIIDLITLLTTLETHSHMMYQISSYGEAQGRGSS